MPTERVDVVVVGAGVTGAASAHALARRGREVVVLEQHDLGHDRGSSHGETRIFRLAYPDPLYVDLGRRALDGWRTLEAESGHTLLELVGGVDHGERAEVEAVAAALRAAGRETERLVPRAAAERWPGLRFEGEVCASPDTGRLYAARALAAMHTGIARHGGVLHSGCRVERIEPQSDARVLVHVDGRTFDASTVVLAAGAWVAGLVRGLVTLPPLVVTEEHAFHFEDRAPAGGWPVFIHHRTVDATVYGLLTPGEGVKVAEHHVGPLVPDAAARVRVVQDERRAAVESYARAWVPGAGPLVTETTCLYTTTDDHDFVLDRRGPVVLASPCSGHGFKFGPVTGALVADLVDGRAPEGRFALPR